MLPRNGKLKLCLGSRTEQKKPPKFRATHLAHSSLQNSIKAALWSISVAGNFLFLDFFIETVDFIRQGQEVAEAKGWDTAGEQLITVGRTEEWSAGRNQTRSQELQKLPASTRFISKILFRGLECFHNASYFGHFSFWLFFYKTLQ